MGEHSEYRIYDDCGHDHREGDLDTTEVQDVGISCEDGYLYSICYVCHTDEGECHEHTPDEQAWPCDAAAAQAKAKELEETYQAVVKRIDELLGQVEQGDDRAKELEEEIIELRAERDAWRRSLVEEEAESE